MTKAWLIGFIKITVQKSCTNALTNVENLGAKKNLLVKTRIHLAALNA